MDKKNIVLWSGGKDSTATIILCHELGIEISEIIMAEVMFCNKRGISGENPLHMKWVHEVAIPKFAEWGYKTTIVRAEVDYLTFFNSVVKKPRKHPEYEGMLRGFPCGKMCGIRRDCKVKPISKYLKENYGNNYTELSGIAIDEDKRLLSMQSRGQRSILAEQGYTEDMAYQLCADYGLLSPGYELSKRGGCWMCCFTRMGEHEYMKTHYPKVWEEFVALENVENVANCRWNVFKETLRERDLQLDLLLKGEIELCGRKQLMNSLRSMW